MAKEKISKWFSNKNLRLSLHHKKSKSSNNGSSSPSSTLSSPFSPKNLKQEEELMEVFRYFDSNGDNKISALELRSYFGSIGEYMSHEEAEAVIDELDSDGDKLLDFQDFLKLMKKEQSKNREEDDDNDDDDLKKAFEMFEMEKGCGCITPKGLQRMLLRLGDSRSYDECVAMIHVFDIDGNGVLDFQEFYQMMA